MLSETLIKPKKHTSVLIDKAVYAYFFVITHFAFIKFNKWTL